MSKNHLQQHAKKVFSQNGEDGAIDFIFNKIGFKSKIFVEFGFGSHENNSKNLIQNYEFEGLFIDSNAVECFRARQYYNDNIHVLNSFVTKSNINELIGSKYRGEIDFLSVDVDGVDLYLLDTIDVIQPRVVCVEYCASIGKDLSVTVHYKDDFNRHKEHKSGMYCGGSLLANIRVMKKKGYKFIGTINGLNAFFVRDEEPMDEMSIDEGFESHYARTYESHPRYDGTCRTMTQEEQYFTIKDLTWINVNREGVIEI